MCITRKSDFPQLTHINAVFGMVSVHEWGLHLRLGTAVIHRYAQACHRQNAEHQLVVRALGFGRRGERRADSMEKQGIKPRENF